MKNCVKFKAFFARFRADDAGAVTTDFVVITGAVVGLALSVMMSVAAGAGDLAMDVEWTLATLDPSGDPPEPRQPPAER